MTRRSCTIYATGIVCAHLLIVGIALLVAQVFPTFIYNRLKKEMTLAEGSRVLDAWKNPPSDVFMQYFFFNVSNPEVFLAGGKAAVTQIGPYTYKEYRPRENLTYLENGTKLSALNPKSFVFVPEMSAGDPEVDRVRTINIPFVAVMNEMSSYSFFIRPLVSLWMNSIGVDLFTTRTVHEMLWGFKDPLLSRIHTLKPDVDEYFGFMYKKNGSHEGEFVFLTGEENYMDFGRIDTWNGLRKMTWWSSNQSNMINGTDGSAFHPLLSKDELLYIFAADLCRSIHLAYVEDVEVQGIPAYRFAPPLDVLASPEDNPANAGFCVPAGKCLSAGVLKVSVCRQGAPIVVSFPHFYQADQKYVNAFEGLTPNKDDHETYLDLNPVWSVYRVPSEPSCFCTYRYCLTFVIDEDSAANMRNLLLIITLVSNLPLFIVGFGAILLLVLVILICRSRQKKVSPQLNVQSSLSCYSLLGYWFLAFLPYKVCSGVNCMGLAVILGKRGALPNSI
uniref:Scavenger receptor class B, member 2a n=1 Tax=Scleropages formosus TaxID=113540 RepID=A0A8C9WBA8_SCLFO